MHVPRPAALRVLAAAALIGAAGLLAAPPASAHNVVVSTAPAADSTVTTLPTSVVLTFEEAPLPGGTAIVVRDPEGTSVTSGATVISGDTATVPLVALTVPGTYGVSYRSASDDGHTITGSFAFVVPESVLPSPSASASGSPTASAPPSAASSSTSPLPTAPTSSTADASSMSAWPLVLGGLAVAVIVGIVVVLLRRRSA